MIRSAHVSPTPTDCPKGVFSFTEWTGGGRAGDKLPVIKSPKCSSAVTSPVSKGRKQTRHVKAASVSRLTTASGHLPSGSLDPLKQLKDRLDKEALE